MLLDILEGLYHLDQKITAAINSMHVSATDTVWGAFSSKTFWAPMYLIIISFFFIKLGWKKALLVLLACMLTFIFCDQLATFIQFLVRRERPDVDMEMTSLGMHYLEPVYKKYIYGFFIFTWAVLVGMSRIFVGKHFLGDVLAGFLVGMAAGWLFSRLARWAIRRFDIK